MRRLPLILPALVFAALAGRVPDAAGQPPGAGQRPDHPRLRAALQELREARTELRESRDAWPPGYKERATQSIERAVESVRTILAVKDVDAFRGFDRDRGQEYYQRYRDHPKLRSALQDLRDARDELRAARADFGGKKEQALDDIEVAIGDILTLVRGNRR